MVSEKRVTTLLVSPVAVVVVVASLLARETVGFAPPRIPGVPSEHLNFIKRGRTSRARNNIILSSTTESDTENESSIATDGFEQGDASKQKTAIESLQRLMARQVADLEETKRVLELYQHADKLGDEAKDSKKEHVLNGEKEDSQPELLSVASSILQGFDYGFVSRSEGPSLDNLHGGNQAFVGYGPPANLLVLGSQQFMRNLKAMRDEYEDEDDVELTPKQAELRDKLELLTLNSTAIWERETKDGPVEGPFIVKIPYFLLCYMLDFVFENQYVPSRFFLLETVARMPYFSYITMLHLYESLGFWRRSADVKRIHFAEELNEFHHLMIMESLGGDQKWWVRLMAQHSAIAYYIGLCLLWAVSPSLSYKFSEMLESHAVNTYSQFLDENEEILKSLPPSLAAVDYYALGSSDPYYAEFQTTSITEKKEIRRPGLDMKNLYDVFSAIRDDEGDHVSTMEACLDPAVAKLSPSLERRALTAVAAAAAIGIFLNTGMVDGGDIVDGVDLAADETVASGLVDAAVAGVAGALSQLGVGAEEGILEEGTALVGLRAIATELAKIFSRLL